MENYSFDANGNNYGLSQMLMSSVLQAVWEADANGVITVDSPTWRAYTGQTSSEYIGSGWLNAVYPEDRGHIEAQWKKSIESYTIYNTEYRLKNENGNWSWTNSIAYPTKDTEGKTVKWTGINLDISERKKAEEKEAVLIKRDKLYDAFMTASFDMVYRMSPDWKEMFMLNGRGYLSDTENTDAKWMMKYINPDDQPHVTDVINKAIHDKSIFELEHRVFKEDGSLGWTHSRAVPITSEAGDIIEWLGMASDITTRREIEDKLTFQANLLDCVDDAIVAVDENDTIVYINKAFEELFGIYGRELLGYNSSCFINENLDEASGIKINTAKANKLSGSSLTYQDKRIEIECTRKDGSKFVADVRMSVNRGLHGEYKGFITALRDITDRKKIESELILAKEELKKKAEDKYHKLFNTIDDGFCIIDVIFDSEKKPIDLRYIESNAAFEELTGLYNVKGKLLSELVPDNEKHWLDFYGRVALTGQPMGIRSESKALNRWYTIYAFKIDSQDSGSVAVLFKDITKEIREKEELEKNLQIQDQMFSNVSHELRTPLNVLLGAIQLMEKRGISEYGNSIDIMRAMKQNCYRLIRLVNNIIDSSKIDLCNMNVDFKNYNIISLVENITLSVVSYATSKGIELVFDTDEEEVIMSTDGDFIERIILNLLSNSLKFTDKDGQILVSIHNKETSVMISIKDSGIGIPEDKQAIIFSRYGQVSKELYRRAEGTGIGLYLTKRLVEILGGTITAHSKYGEGAEFIIEFPINLMEESSEEKFMHSRLSERIKVEFSDIYNV